MPSYFGRWKEKLGKVDGASVISLEVEFANDALGNTQNVYVVPKPDQVKGSYMVHIENPSTVTDLSVKFFISRTGKADGLLVSVQAGKATTDTGTNIGAYDVIMLGAFAGGDLKIVASNDTQLGAAEGFEAKIELYEM